jgi:uncharacterized membrane protein
MTLSLTLAAHALAAVVWVGGMAFAYWFVRPAAGTALQGPQRLALWRGVFARFFPAVWVSVVVLLATGYLMLFGFYGGFGGAGVHVHVMHALGLVMVALFAHVFFAPWRRLRRAVDTGEGDGPRELDRIRRFVAINLALGLIVIAVASGGRFWG